MLRIISVILLFGLSAGTVSANPISQNKQTLNTPNTKSPTTPHINTNKIKPASDWHSVTSDLEILEVATVDGGIFSASLLFVRTGLKRFRAKAVRAKDYDLSRANAKTIAAASGATVAINANFFDHTGQPLGLVISRGLQLQPLHRGGKLLTGIFQISDKGISIKPRSSFETRGVLEAIQSGPRLISKGVATTGLKDAEISSRRAGLCIDKFGNLIFFCSRTAWGGIGMSDLQKILLNPKIGCTEALNLDGGGSAQLYIGLKDKTGNLIYEQYIPGRDAVPVGLVLQENL